MGIATIIQLYLGSKLPIVQGSSFAFITPIIAVATMNATNNHHPMQYIAGALIAGGLFETIIGYSGLIGKLKRLITPVVMGPTIMLIGFSLFNVAVQLNAANYWPVSLLVVALIFFFALILKGLTRVFPVLLSIISVYILCWILSVVSVFQPGHPAFISFDSVQSAQWIRFSRPFQYGLPIFTAPAILSVLAAFIVSMIESVGDYHSVSYVSGLTNPSEKTISKGIGAEGLGCIIGGVFGGSGATSYTENIGLIGLTGVASRYVILIGAFVLIILSFIGKLGALIATMPSPIIGGAYIALFGIIGGLGIQVLTKCDLRSQRNIMIIGFFFLMGFGVGCWMGGYCGVRFYAKNPTLWGSTGLGKILWDITSAVLSTHMAVGAFCGLLLDNIIPGTDDERGLKI